MADEENKQPAPPPKSKLGLVLGLVGGIVVLVGGAVGGAILAPKLTGAPADAHAATASAEPPPPKNVVTAKFDPFIVDVRGQKGELHHLKVGVSVELADEVTTEQFDLFAPRGRAAAVAYLRSLGFKDATDPTKYEEIQKVLAEKITEAVGKDKVARVLVVDFVAQ